MSELKKVKIEDPRLKRRDAVKDLKVTVTNLQQHTKFKKPTLKRSEAIKKDMPKPK